MNWVLLLWKVNIPSREFQPSGECSCQPIGDALNSQTVEDCGSISTQWGKVHVNPMGTHLKSQTEEVQGSI